jgi:hypothetical protein
MQTSKAVRVQAYLGRVEWATRLLNEIKPKGKIVGVEVGLWKADFALLMLKENKRLHWFGVDPYTEYGRKYRKQKQWDGIYDKVVNKMKPYKKRFMLIRALSSEAVRFIPDGVDFVFIDGNHDPDMVYNDLLLYEKKVRPGGIMAGHDYMQRVAEPVNDYVKKFDRKLFIDASFDPCGVFWWRVK